MQELESLREVESLRFRFQMNNRLRLESLAELSKLFREFGEPISDDLLSSLVFALPQELVSNGYSHVGGPPMEANADQPPTSPQPGPNNPPTQPGPPNIPPTQPGPPNIPPTQPGPPNIPPTQPGPPNIPPTSPKPGPNLPPTSPKPTY
jgi:hypothetical protein